MPSVTLYNSYCEIFHQFPAINVGDLSGAKPGYAAMSSVAKLSGPTPISMNLKMVGWWRDNRPTSGSMIVGNFMVATPPTGVELIFEKDAVETRPGLVADPRYVARHRSVLPMTVDFFGRVKVREEDWILVEGQTYTPTGRKNFELQVSVDDSRSQEHLLVGMFVGGRGPVTGLTAANGLRVAVDSLRYAKVPATTTGEVDPTRPNPPLTTTCVSAFRFKVVSACNTTLTVEALGQSGTSITLTLDSTALGKVAPGSVISAGGVLGYGPGGLTLRPRAQELEVRPANQSDATDYLARQTLDISWHMRITGVVTRVEETAFWLQSANSGLPMTARVLVPSTQRFSNFSIPAVGSAVSVRGPIIMALPKPKASPGMILTLDHMIKLPIVTQAAVSSAEQSGQLQLAWLQSMSESGTTPVNATVVAVPSQVPSQAPTDVAKEPNAEGSSEPQASEQTCKAGSNVSNFDDLIGLTCVPAEGVEQTMPPGTPDGVWAAETRQTEGASDEDVELWGAREDAGEPSASAAMSKATAKTPTAQAATPVNTGCAKGAGSSRLPLSKSTLQALSATGIQIPVIMPPPDAPKRGRGRPKGSKNKKPAKKRARTDHSCAQEHRDDEWFP